MSSLTFLLMPAVARALLLDAVKMDDRKRLAPDEHVQITPKAKRQAVTVNGAPGRSDEDFPRDEELDVCQHDHLSADQNHIYQSDTDMISLIQRFQKDAILRQMREYKREKVMLEQQLIQVNKRSEYHDEHLRVVDSWFSQVRTDIPPPTCPPSHTS